MISHTLCVTTPEADGNDGLKKANTLTDTTGYFSIVITEESIITPAWLGEYAARLKGYFSLV